MYQIKGQQQPPESLITVIDRWSALLVNKNTVIKTGKEIIPVGGCSKLKLSENDIEHLKPAINLNAF